MQNILKKKKHNKIEQLIPSFFYGADYQCSDTSFVKSKFQSVVGLISVISDIIINSNFQRRRATMQR